MMNKIDNNHQIDTNQKEEKKKWKWKLWHERERSVKINSQLIRDGIKIKVQSAESTTDLSLVFPKEVWRQFPKTNRRKLLDNVAYIFTAHLPFLLKGNIRTEYNTCYPHSFLWANISFMRNLTAYWYLLKSKRGSHTSSMLKTLLNSRSIFAPTRDVIPEFPTTIDEKVLIPFSFGKDSFLTYYLAKEIDLKPTLIWFNDPIDEGYEGKHKKILYKRFKKVIKEDFYIIDNPLGSLREKGEGWFGWELAITSWLLLSIPFAYKHKTGYVIVSNEKSTNSFFYDKDGIRVLPDYEQSAQATEELSLLSQALTEGEVYTTTLLQGINEVGIIAVLKKRYYQNTFNFLMSCWSETESGKEKKWCGNCSKCARIYLYLAACDVNPIKEAGFKDNMFLAKHRKLYNVFGEHASGTGWDAFGLNDDEQAFAFFLCSLRGIKAPLVQSFEKNIYFREVKDNFGKFLDEFYGLHPEDLTPLEWKTKIRKILNSELKIAREDAKKLYRDKFRKNRDR